MRRFTQLAENKIPSRLDPSTSAVVTTKKQHNRSLADRVVHEVAGAREERHEIVLVNLSILTLANAFLSANGKLEQKVH